VAKVRALAEIVEGCPPLTRRIEGDSVTLLEAFDRLIQLSGVHARSIPDGIAFIGNPLRWDPLTEPGLRERVQAEAKLLSFSSLVRTVVAVAAAYHLPEVDKALKALTKLVNRPSNASAPVGSRELPAWTRKQLGTVMECIGQIAAGGPDESVILIPDTNAVLFQPRWELWADPAGAATIALLPAVLRELDRLKVEGNAEVKRKAELEATLLIELHRRGDVRVGVPVAGHLRLRLEAVEPDMEATLGWLRADVADDQLVATVLEVAARYPNDRVLLVTRDMLLQSKATNAGICWARPDDLGIPAEPAPIRVAPPPTPPKLVLQFDPGSLQSAATTQEGHEMRQTLQVMSLSDFPVYLRTLIVQGRGFLAFSPLVLQAHATKEFVVTFQMANGSVLQISLVALRADELGEAVVFNREFMYGSNGLQLRGS
jgi:PIN domain